MQQENQHQDERLVRTPEELSIALQAMVAASAAAEAAKRALELLIPKE